VFFHVYVIFNDAKLHNKPGGNVYILIWFVDILGYFHPREPGYDIQRAASQNSKTALYQLF